jgi:branched-chain amino acid transport system ATP-binding protein
MISLENIDVYYGELAALRNISMDVNKGDLAVVIGSNGAGKTTLLRTISGLNKPRKGSIKFKDKQIDKMPVHQLPHMGIGHVQQERGIFTDMTVMENINLGATPTHAKKEKEETIQWVLELFPILKSRGDQLAGTLSGGEQQMLAVARVLMLKPDLILIDEPSTGLAPVIVKELFEILSIVNKKGITMILVEQNVKQALKIGTCGFVLENGKIVLKGICDELLSDERVKKACLGM